MINTQLVLRDNNITDVPAEVSKCSNLKTLHLQFNQINVVPPELGMNKYNRALIKILFLFSKTNSVYR